MKSLISVAVLLAIVPAAFGQRCNPFSQLFGGQRPQQFQQRPQYQQGEIQTLRAEISALRVRIEDLRLRLEAGRAGMADIQRKLIMDRLMIEIRLRRLEGFHQDNPQIQPLPSQPQIQPFPQQPITQPQQPIQIQPFFFQIPSQPQQRPIQIQPIQQQPRLLQSLPAQPRYLPPQMLPIVAPPGGQQIVRPSRPGSPERYARQPSRFALARPIR